MRAPLIALACAAALLIGCDGSSEPESAVRTIDTAALAGAPAPLAALHRQSSRLLDGGPRAFKARLRELRGHPVVVNKWASWCPPCRAEFPYFQRQATRRAKDVAFVGVDSDDHDGDAREFLDEYPVPYPSYKDPEQDIARLFNGVQGFPVTAFYDSKGGLEYVHYGGYANEKKLAQDIERYAR